MGPPENPNSQLTMTAATALNLNDTTREILSRAQVERKICRGTNQTVKQLIRQKATAILLATDCTEKEIGPTIEALAKKNNVPILSATRAVIGEASGPRLNAEGEAKNVVKT